MDKQIFCELFGFLTEINDKTKEVPAELLENPEINKALEEVKISAFYFRHEHREDIFFPLCKILYILLV